MPTSRTGCSLFDYSKPRSVLFHPPKAYMKSARRPLPEVSESTSGGATPMPDRTSSLTPAWDPLSRTPRYFSIFFRLIQTYWLQNL